MYVYMHVCMYIYIHIYMYINVCMLKNTYICAYMRICIYMIKKRHKIIIKMKLLYIYIYNNRVETR